jgi:hypothetical protein
LSGRGSPQVTALFLNVERYKVFGLITGANPQEECNMRGRTEHGFLSSLAALLAMLMTLPSTVPVVWAANHREAPITLILDVEP